MSRPTIAVAGLLLAMLGVAAAGWTGIGPSGGPIYSAATVAGGNPALHIATTNTSYPLLRSTDAGASWQPHGANLTNYPRKLVAHPTDPNRLYGIVSSQFYRTTDGGLTWTQSSLGSNTNGNDIIINPLNPQTIYVPCYKYINSAWKPASVKSTDGGQTWTATQVDTVTTSTIYSGAIDPVDTTVIYIGVYWNSTTAVYKSTDCGQTWARNQFPTSAYYVYSMMVDPGDHDVVFAGTLYGVYRSTDAGVTWTRQSTNNYNYQLAFAPDDSSWMYSAAYSRLYRSSDRGLTWTTATAFPGTQIRTVMVRPGEPGAVYCGSTAGMFKSTDRGQTWNEINSGIVVGRIPTVSVSPHEPATVWAEFIDNDIYRTTNDGQTWEPAETPLSCGNV
ncbi:hypothetical protein JXB37_02530, partial [candidate division WOR-3 bacterium]|nr:hypothetical protein [candidate division WOR-3 bacterium]